MLQSLISGKTTCPFSADISNEAENGNHFHGELELIYVLSGRMTYILAGQHYRLKARDFIFANPYELHSVSNVSEDCYYVHFLIEESRMRSLFSATDTMLFNWQESLNNRDKELHREITEAVHSIITYSSHQKNDFLAVASQQMMRIMVALNRWCRKDTASDKGGKKTLNQQQKSTEIMDYLNAHYMEDVSLNTLSKVLFLSPPYISKIFKENFQVGVLEYLNRLRIQKSIFPLCHTNAYIADIAEECGFTNAKTYSRIFQKEMGISPTDYRSRYVLENSAEQPLVSPVKQELMQFLALSFEKDAAIREDSTETIPVRFDFTVPAEPGRFPPWNRVLYVGKADLLLSNAVQNAVARAIDDFEVEFVRFSGVLSDGLHMYSEDENGNPHYFWLMLDDILHFLLKHKVKPFINLGFMPKQLASAETPSPYDWDANISKPKSAEKWVNYLSAFINHLTQCFSYEEVCTWRFDFWGDPALPGVFWYHSEAEFKEFFLLSYKTFLSALPGGKLGTPCFTVLNDFEFAGRFLSWCKERDVRFDFLSLHVFELTDPKNPDEAKINSIGGQEKFRGLGSGFVAETAERFSEVARAAGYTSPIAITEWNVSPYFHDLSRDTSFMGTYIFDTINRLPECVSSITFWALTDYTGEHKPIQDMFSGELGMRTINDLAKPSYLALKLLKRLRGDVLQKGESYIVTRSNFGHHVALYNYSFYNEEFLNGTSRPLSKKDRYQIFEHGRLKRFHLALTLEPGHYRIERYVLDRDHGSIYDGWIRMGAPDFIDKMAMGYLDKLAYPELTIEYRNIHKHLVFSEEVPTHGIVLFNLVRLGDEMD